MNRTRTFAVAALAGLALVLTGCGSENAPDGSSGSDSGTTVEPGTETPSVSSDNDSPADDLGTVVLNQKLDVSPAQYPLPDVPTEAEAASVADLAKAFAMAPGIDEIAAELESVTLAPGERFFVYLVNSCTTDDVSLLVQENEVPMIVKGTALLRCAPPTTMVVWVVGDEIPTDAKPAHAIQQ